MSFLVDMRGLIRRLEVAPLLLSGRKMELVVNVSRCSAFVGFDEIQLNCYKDK